MKKYLLLTLFLVIALASPVLADGRGRGRGHGAAHYKHAQKWDKHAFKARKLYGPAYRAYPAYGFYRPYPVYVAPVPVYGYYPACPAPYPPPVYDPYYGRPGVRGHIGVDIIF
ncbi:MAG: hypothetical protein ACE15E_19780 [Acidobacteriota bacterium]